MRRGGTYRQLLDLTERLLADFEAAGYERIDPPMLHDAAHVGLGGQTLLELTYLMGNGLALRSDFTVPVYLLHTERGREAGTPRYCYAGPVFRRTGPGDDRPTEQMQLGIEYFGSLRRAAADVRIFANILSGLDKTGVAAQVLTGDVALWHGLLDALAMSEAARGRLREMFWRPERLRAQIDRMAVAEPLPEALAGKDVEAIAAALPPVAGKRSVAEVAARMHGRAGPDVLAAEVAALLHGYLDIACPIGQVPERVRDAVGDRIDLGPFEERLSELRHRLGPEALTTPFRADFGRRHEYYDGFVFEMTGADGAVLGAGGRYDRLSRQVSAADWPAIGGMIRPQAVLATVEGA